MTWVKVLGDDSQVKLGPRDTDGEVCTDSTRVPLTTTMGHGEGVREAIGGDGLDRHGVVELAKPFTIPGTEG